MATEQGTEVCLLLQHVNLRREPAQHGRRREANGPPLPFRELQRLSSALAAASASQNAGPRPNIPELGEMPS